MSLRRQRPPVNCLDHCRELFLRRGFRYLALILLILGTILNPVSILSKSVTVTPKSNESNKVPWRKDQLSHCPDSKVRTIFDVTYTLPFNNNGTSASSTSPSQDDNNPNVIRIPPNLLANSKSGLDKELKFIQQNVIRNSAYFPGWKSISDDDASCLQKIKKIKESSISSTDMVSWFISHQTPGKFKSDLCRLAQLYLHGGVYLDNDLELTSSLIDDLMTGVEIISAVEADFGQPLGIFQAILGSPPGRNAVVATFLGRTIYILLSVCFCSNISTL